MNKNFSLFLSVSVAVAILSGCGGSDGIAKGNIGYYKGSSIVGVDYNCGNKTGKTGSGGKFEFQDGKGCTFSIGDLVLKKVMASGLNDDVKIVEKNEKVIALLMTLDKDGDEELKVTADSLKALKKEGIKKIDDISDDKLELIAEDVKLTVARIDDAKKHIEASKNKYKGNLKALLSGNTFYAVDVEDNSDYDIDKIVFNADATSIKITDDEGSGELDITIDGNKISSGDEYGIYLSKTDDYILFEDFEDGESDGHSRFYYSKAKAEAYINSHLSGATGGIGGTSN